MTAVFAANDDMAIGLIRAQLEAGRRVPEDISVVGFDDIPVAAYVTPPLTTVRQPFDAVARQGLARAGTRHREAGRRASTAADQPVELVVRASTAPPPPRPIPGRGRRAIPHAHGGPHGQPAGSEAPSTQPDQRRSVHLRRHVTRGPHRPSLTSGGSTRAAAHLSPYPLSPARRCPACRSPLPF